MSEQKKIRAFIAVELSSEAREELGRVIGLLKKADVKVKWVNPETLHLTLRFLGYVPEEEIEAISRDLESIASGSVSFDMTLGKVGVFPGWKHPNVIWVGVEGGKEGVTELAHRVEEGMEIEGLEIEKKNFRAHLTIGRVKSPGNKEKLKSIAESLKIEPAVSNVSKMILFKSDLTSEGAVHTPIKVCEFPG